MKPGCLPTERERKTGTKGPTQSSDHLQCGQKQKVTDNLKRQKEEKGNLSKVEGQKGPCHLLPHAGFCGCCVTPFYVLSVTLSLISFATSAMLCAVRKVILEFLTCADIY